MFGYDTIRRGVLEKMPPPEIREEQRVLGQATTPAKDKRQNKALKDAGILDVPVEQRGSFMLHPDEAIEEREACRNKLAGCGELRQTAMQRMALQELVGQWHGYPTETPDAVQKVIDALTTYKEDTERRCASEKKAN